MDKPQLIFGSVLFVVLAIILSTVFVFVEYGNAKEKLDNSLLYISHLEHLTGIGRLDTTHIHADVKMFISGEEYNLYREELFEVNKFTHFHSGESNLNVIHVHALGITFADFLRTTGIVFDNNCVLIGEESICDTADEQWKIVVNSQEVESIDFVIRDHDQILLTYGDGSMIEEQFATVGTLACVKSENC